MKDALQIFGIVLLFTLPTWLKELDEINAKKIAKITQEDLIATIKSHERHLTVLEEENHKLSNQQKVHSK